jgi:PAS domain S-box-containing protein
VNDRFSELFGWSAEETLGRTADDLHLVEGDIVAHIRNELALHRSVRDRELSLTTRTGDVRQILMSVEQLQLRDEWHAVTTMIDITARKTAETQLLEHKDRLAAIIEHEPECVKIVDPAGRLVEMNPAGLAMLEADVPRSSRCFSPCSRATQGASSSRSKAAAARDDGSRRMPRRCAAPTARRRPCWA